MIIPLTTSYLKVGHCTPTKTIPPRRGGDLTATEFPTAPKLFTLTSRFRHRICSFIWVETAKGVFTSEDDPILSARVTGSQVCTGDKPPLFLCDRRQVLVQESLSRGHPKEGNKPCDL